MKLDKYQSDPYKREKRKWRNYHSFSAKKYGFYDLINRNVYIEDPKTKQKLFRSRKHLKKVLRWESWSSYCKIGGIKKPFVELINKKISSVPNHSATISALKKNFNNKILWIKAIKTDKFNEVRYKLAQ